MLAASIGLLAGEVSRPTDISPARRGDLHDGAQALSCGRMFKQQAVAAKHKRSSIALNAHLRLEIKQVSLVMRAIGNWHLELPNVQLSPSDHLRSDTNWVERSMLRCFCALASARTAADRVALLRSLIRLKGGQIDLFDLDWQLGPAEFALLARFGIAQTNSDRSLRIVDEEDARGLDGLGAALRFDPFPRNAYEPATPDGALLRLTGHSRYRTSAQKAATRALLTQPPGSGLMVSMPTGSGKSLLFQIAANFERETQAGACAIVITPTVALDHERTLSGMPGLERSKALTADIPQSSFDLQELEKLRFQRFSVQPMDGPSAASNTRIAVELCLQRPRWQLSLQTHKTLGIR